MPAELPPPPPGYAGRWLRAAARQLLAHPAWWVLTLAPPVLCALMATHDPWRTLVGVALGPWAWALGLEAAAATATRATVGAAAPRGAGLRPQELPALWRTAWRTSVETLRRQRNVLALTLGLGALSLALAYALARALATPTTAVAPADGAARSVALFLPVAVQLFVGLTLVHGLAPAAGGLRPLLQRLAGLEAEAAARQVARAMQRAPGAFLFLDAMLQGTVFVVLLWAPPLAPLALAFLPALLLAAAHELFGTGAQPAAPQAEDVREAAAVR